MIAIQDPLRFSDKPMVVSQDAFFIISMFDGDHSILDIQEKYSRRFGSIIFSDRIRDIIERLDSKFFLESENFEKRKKQVSEEFKASSIRAPFHAGNSYEADPNNLRAQLSSFFTPPEGPGELQKDIISSEKIKGIVAPHIDLSRGGRGYAWAYKEVSERCDADLFIILGTSHSESENQFILTKKDFQTPLGVMVTDKDFVDLIAKDSSADLFEDEIIHKYEHSIEFQVLFLQYVLQGRKNVKILPILCSSFHEMIEKNVEPSEFPAFNEFISLLREIISQSDRTVCFIAGADLSHVGKRFGDQVSLSSNLLQIIRSRDMEMLQYVEQLDASGFFRSIQEDGDERKICGLPPIYTMLSAMNTSHGKLVKYYQAPERNTDSVVSFASMYFV
jgi:hypothetical protein